MHSAALIVNPFSTRVTEAKLEAVQETLSRYVELETFPTSRRDHATELAREAANNHDAVLVFSGDGVFNEVVNGIEKQVPLGFIPGGRTNVLPRALGLPRDCVAAAQRIGEALAAGRTHDGRLPGDATAAWVLLQQFAQTTRYTPRLRIEGLGRASGAFVMNGSVSTYVGRLPVRFAPNAQFELGLDVAGPVELRARSLPALAWRGLRGKRVPGVLYGHDLDRVTVYCDLPMPLQVDGEDLGDVREAHFEAERGAAMVLA